MKGAPRWGDFIRILRSDEVLWCMPQNSWLESAAICAVYVSSALFSLTAVLQIVGWFAR